MDTIGIKDRRERVQMIKNYTKSSNISINKLCVNAVLYCISNGIDVSSIDADSITGGGNDC